MAHEAVLTLIGEHPGRSAPRRVVNFAAHVRDVGAEIAQASVTDLSTDGCKFHCDRALEPATEIWLKIRGAGARRARIVWSRGGEYGCEFASPMELGTVEELAEASYLAMKKRWAVARD